MQDGCTFDHGESGPSGVRALSNTIGQFVSQLEDIVDQRADQLREKTKPLGSEIEVRIAAEEKLEAARIGAENANEAKSEFLANMSHEIRPPLNAILGFTDFLNDSQLDEEQANYVHIVRSSGNSLLTLVNDILDFSKIEAGKTRD